MLLLIVGLVVFIGIHLVSMNRELRAGLIGRFGEAPYKIAYSVIALVGLAVIVVGYGKLQLAPGKNPEIWTPPFAFRHVALLLLLPAMVLLVAANVPSRIRTLVGHPMLFALKLWALAHLMSNGDLASIVLFGSLLAYAVVDLISVKRRTDGSGLGPLGAARGGLVGDLVAVGGGLALYAAMVLGLHRILFGVAPLPQWSM